MIQDLKNRDVNLLKKSKVFFYNFISSKEMTAHTKQKEEKKVKSRKNPEGKGKRNNKLFNLHFKLFYAEQIHCGSLLVFK